MTWLDVIADYESVQIVLVVCIGACVLGLIITTQINRQINRTENLRLEEQKWKESVADKELQRREVALRLQDEMQESEHKRKTEWHLLTTQPTLIESRRKEK